ncbi:MAG: ABC transporter substrate-binding protein [Oleiphilaceae bacterium]|nr:ABC transporter substrate-binding protein [Oleiphilaceae bacterium]
MSGIRHLLIFVLLLLCSSMGLGQSLSIAANPVDGKQRDAFQRQINLFQQAHPDYRVTLKIYEHEQYKELVNASLAQGEALADVLFWFGGSTTRNFADKGWLSDLSELWRNENWLESFSPAAISTVTRRGRQYGLPLYYYQWGIYYRQSLFDKLQLRPAQTLEELDTLNERLREAGVTPFTLGSKNHWPAAAWFDYFNLRLNGIEFHETLLAGCHSFLDERVTRVIEAISELVQRGDFIETPQENDWKGALPFLYHNKAAMVLMGNFFLASVPMSLQTDFAFAPFPLAEAGHAYVEDAPIDILIVPAASEDTKARKDFLRMMAQPDTQSQLAASLNMIPPNRKSTLPANPHIRQGADLLNQAAGLAQFFDRDTHPDFAQRALPVLSRLFSEPASALRTQRELEEARLAVWPNENRDRASCGGI